MLVFEARGNSREPTNQQTQPILSTESGNRTRATLVGGEFSIPAPRSNGIEWDRMERKYSGKKVENYCCPKEQPEIPVPLLYSFSRATAVFWGILVDVIGFQRTTESAVPFAKWTESNF